MHHTHRFRYGFDTHVAHLSSCMCELYPTNKASLTYNSDLVASHHFHYVFNSHLALNKNRSTKSGQTFCTCLSFSLFAMLSVTNTLPECSNLCTVLDRHCAGRTSNAQM